MILFLRKMISQPRLLENRLHPNMSLPSFLPKAGLVHAHWPLKNCLMLQKRRNQFYFQAPPTHLLYLLPKGCNGSVLLDLLRLEGMKNFRGV